MSKTQGKRIINAMIPGFLIFQSAMVQSADMDSDLSVYYPDEEVTSISTGTYKAIHLAPSVATVIRADEIKTSGARTLDEVLETVPGLHVYKSFARNSSNYSIRGIHAGWNAQVLLLVNGLPFNDIITGARPPLFQLPVENIALIEIIRGPGSAVYGADAFAGVINVITKEGLDIDGVEIGGRTGSFDTKDAWVQYGGDLGDWEVGLSVEYSSSEGDRNKIVNSDYQTTLDAMFNTSASLTPGPLESRYRMLNSSITLQRDEWSIWFNSWNLSDAGVGPGAYQALDPVGSQEDDQYTLIINYKNDSLAEDWQLDSRFSYRVLDQQSIFRLLPPGTVVPIGADGNLFTDPGCSSPTDHTTFGPVCLVTFSDGLWGNPGGELTDIRFEIAGIYQGWLRQRLRFAVGTDYDEFQVRATQNYGPSVIDGTVSPIDGTLTDVTGTPYIFVQDSSRTVRFLSLQDEWRFTQNWELTAGIRYDDYSDFGGTTNPRLALVWETEDYLTTKLLYGRAFRAPSMTELYFQNNPVVIGNPNLKPETIDMLELVFDYRPSSRLQSVLNLFVYQADDLIEFVNNVAQNSHSQDGYGFEFEANWFATDTLQLKGNFAFQHSEDAETGTVIPDAPRQQLFLAANWRFYQQWSFYGQANWIADRARASTDPRSAINDYTTVDVALRFQAKSQKWELATRVNNIFDADAREPSDGTIPDDYPLEGRSLYLEGIIHI